MGEKLSFSVKCFVHNLIMRFVHWYFDGWTLVAIEDLDKAFSKNGTCPFCGMEMKEEE